MMTRWALAGLALTFAGAARAEGGFSLICDEKVQLEDVLRTTREHGFQEASLKFRAYQALRDERNEPTCEVAAPPDPGAVGRVVARYDAVEFLPAQIHNVLVVEFQVGERVLFATLNRFVSEKAAETGL
jgi:hypothetical protein